MKKVNKKVLIAILILLIFVSIIGVLGYQQTVNKTNEKQSNKTQAMQNYINSEEGVLEEKSGEVVADVTGETVENSGIVTRNVDDVPEGWDTTKVYVAEDSTGVKVPVPIGYVVSGATGETQ